MTRAHMETGDTTGTARPSTPTNSDHSSLHGANAPNNTQAAYRRANNARQDSAMSYKILFAKRFAAFLRENFQTPEHIAICFGVTARQAANWLDETSAPRGHVVARAFTDPSLEASARKHLTEV